jgi:hypothetical protein
VRREAEGKPGRVLWLESGDNKIEAEEHVNGCVCGTGKACGRKRRFAAGTDFVRLRRVPLSDMVEWWSICGIVGEEREELALKVSVLQGRTGIACPNSAPGVRAASSSMRERAMAVMRKWPRGGVSD